MDEDVAGLPAGSFGKVDGGDDLDFYAQPRFVTHIDDAAIRALTAFYGELIPPGAAVLDLMSSYVSHLPPSLALASVIGHGMNDDELAANPRLTRRFVQNLNANPALPIAPASLDAALCCVGVQYLQHPVAVFTAVRHALKPGAPFAVSYSNRCFPTKAVAIWRSLDMPQQAALVRLYMERAGFAHVEAKVLADGRRGDPLIAVIGRTAG